MTDSVHVFQTPNYPLIITDFIFFLYITKALFDWLVSDDYQESLLVCSKQNKKENYTL